MSRADIEKIRGLDDGMHDYSKEYIVSKSKNGITFFATDRCRCPKIFYVRKPTEAEIKLSKAEVDYVSANVDVDDDDIIGIMYRDNNPASSSLLLTDDELVTAVAKSSDDDNDNDEDDNDGCLDFLYPKDVRRIIQDFLKLSNSIICSPFCTTASQGYCIGCMTL